MPPILITSPGERFVKLHASKEYIDKRGFINALLENDKYVVNFIAPSGFGKSSLLSMAYCFFSCKEWELYKNLFADLEIHKSPQIYGNKTFSDHQGRYPVIYVDFSAVHGNNFAEVYPQIVLLIKNLFNQFPELQDTSGRISKYDQTDITDFLNKKISPTLVRYSLLNLSELLRKYYKENVIIMVDGYDHLYFNSYEHGYAEEFIPFLNGMLENALKDNPNLHSGIIMGAMDVTRPGLRSGLNNVIFHRCLTDKLFAPYFGITQEEMHRAFPDLPTELLESPPDFYHQGKPYMRTSIITQLISGEKVLLEHEVSSYKLGM